MPAPGTRGKIPVMRNTVTGAFRQKANTRANQARARVAKKEAVATSSPKWTHTTYTSHPTAPVKPQHSHSLRGVWKMMAKVMVERNATPICSSQ